MGTNKIFYMKANWIDDLPLQTHPIIPEIVKKNPEQHTDSK